MKTLFTLLLSLSAFALFGQTQIFISTQGKDNNDGSKEYPVRSLERAQELIKKAEADGLSGIEVLFREGTYQLSDTVSLVDYKIPLTFKPAAGEQVAITSGIELSSEQIRDIQDEEILALLRPETKGKIKEIDLNSLGIQASGEWALRFRGYAGWPELYFNDTPLQISRWPNEGFSTIERVIEKGSVPRHNVTSDKPASFIYKETNPSSWNGYQDIYLAGYWCFKWYDEIIKVDRILPEKKEIILAAPHHYGVGGPSGGLFYAINLLEEIDLPGEYVYDRIRNKIYLLPPEDFSIESKLDIAYKQETLFTIQNSKNISFQHITFTGHNGIMFDIKQSSNIIFDNCTFSNISKTAVNILGGEKCGLINCHLFNIGESGVVMEGGNRENLESSGHFATRCHIHHYARHIKTNCPALHIKGVGQRLVQNYIHDAPHTAIFFWGNDHLIDRNRIERVCLNTSDAGAIYTGRDWTFGGNVVSNNYISNLGEASHHHNWGIYIDDMASGVEVRGNIIANSPSGMLLGGGRSNVVKNNLMINTPQASIRFDSRAMGWAKGHVEKYSGTLWVRLLSLPYNKSPWKERFPYLQDLDKDKHAEPRHNNISGNFIINSEKVNLDKVVVKHGTVENNKYIKKDLEIRLDNGKVKFVPKQDFLDEFEGIELFVR